jgi:hypothetical protein
MSLAKMDDKYLNFTFARQIIIYVTYIFNCKQDGKISPS